MSNISIVFLGFREGAKAMSKTARHYHSRPSRKPKQRPAILPWLSGLPLHGRATIRPVFPNRQRFRCRIKRGHFWYPPQTREQRRA
jgi:hypothetical protein